MKHLMPVLPKEALLDTTILLVFIFFIEIDLLYWRNFCFFDFNITKFYNCFFHFYMYF